MGEHAQNPCTVRWPARKGVEMQQIVALVQRQIAAFLFLRPKTREIQIPFAGVRSQKFGQELRHLSAVIPHDRVNAAHRLAVARDSAQQSLTLPVRNVLVHSHLRPLLLEKKLLIGRRQVERWLAKEKYLAALQ